jgi:hypothetical protein
MPPPRVQGKDAARVADRQGADPVLHGPGDHGLGGFVVGLADSTAVPRLGEALAAAELSPAPRAALAGRGCPPRHRPAAGLAVFEVLVAFGTDGPA